MLCVFSMRCAAQCMHAFDPAAVARPAGIEGIPSPAGIPVGPSNGHYATHPSPIIVDARKVSSCKKLTVARKPPSTMNYLAAAVGQHKYAGILPRSVLYALTRHVNVECDAVADIIVHGAEALFCQSCRITPWPIYTIPSLHQAIQLCVR